MFNASYNSCWMQASFLMQSLTLLFLALCVLPGGPGGPGGPGKNTGDVRIFSLVICSGTSALLDSMAILNKDAEIDDWMNRSIETLTTNNYMNDLSNNEYSQQKYIVSHWIKVIFLMSNIQIHNHFVIWLSFLKWSYIQWFIKSCTVKQDRRITHEGPTSTNLMLKLYTLLKMKADLPSAPRYKQ